MKIITFFCILTCSFFQSSPQDNEFLGSWSVNKAYNEMNKLCEKKSPMIKDFKLRFITGGNYEMTTNYGDIIITKGKYRVDKTNNVLTLDYKIQNSSYTSKIPIHTLEKDVLILKYNLCGGTDSTSAISGKLELIRTN